MKEVDFVALTARLKKARTAQELDELELEIARLPESEQRLALMSMAKSMRVLLEEQGKPADGRRKPD